MSIMSKVAIAVDTADWAKIEKNVKEIGNWDFMEDRWTPDNTYRCVYWEDIAWSGEPVWNLTRALDKIRHSMITISEYGEIDVDNVSYDDRGTDEEFDELLSWRADICWWQGGEPLATRQKHIPITRDRLIEAFQIYIENDMAAGNSRVYYALCRAGLFDEEIESLGFGDLVPGSDDETPFGRKVL